MDPIISKPIIYVNATREMKLKLLYSTQAVSLQFTMFLIQVLV